MNSKYHKPHFNKKYSKTRRNDFQSRKQPNWFFAIPIENVQIKEKMKNVQEKVTESKPELIDACVPIEKAHMTLFVFYNENVDPIIAMVNEVIESYKFDSKLTISVNGIGHFSQKVLYSNLFTDQNFQDFWQVLANKLFENSIISENEAKWKNFKPHLSIMRLSLLKSNNSSPKIPINIVKPFCNETFGIESVTKIQLLSRTHPVQENGYYYCEKEFSLKYK